MMPGRAGVGAAVLCLYLLAGLIAPYGLGAARALLVVTFALHLGFWAVLTAGVTPFPYKVITIMSGWTGMPFMTFMLTSLLARGLRFFIVAALLWKFGTPVRDFIEKRLGLVATLFLILLFGGFYLVKHL